VLGVCLGHQCIGEVFGGSVVRHHVMHGKTSEITHDGQGIFQGLPDPLVATRYHSLVVAADSVPPSLVTSAWAEDGTVMGFRHRSLPIEGVQFHPESILTEGGHRLLANWLAVCRQPSALAAVPSRGRGLP
jgi:anthranilate synthase/aminodeoxychorismate synthase-like glutamine amidotransferase